MLNLRTKTAANQVAAGRAFALRAESPLIDAGVDLANLGVRPGPANYAGQRVPASHPNIAAM
ncbi:MAG: hypothetical protein WAK82_10270 [Streptosporangiaceae bacterium]